MKLQRIIVKKKMENKNNYLKNQKHRYGYEEHISVYLTCLAFLGRIDDLIDYKKNVWKRFISAYGDEQKRYYHKLLEWESQENFIIIEAIKEMDIEIESKINIGQGGLWKPFTWGVLTSDIEEIE